MVVEHGVGQSAHDGAHPLHLLRVALVEAGHEAQHEVVAAVHGPADDERREAVLLEQRQPRLGARHPRRPRTVGAHPGEAATGEVEQEVERGRQLGKLGQPPYPEPAQLH